MTFSYSDSAYSHAALEKAVYWPGSTTPQQSDTARLSEKNETRD